MTDDPVARLRAGLDADEAAAKAVTFRSRFIAAANSVMSPGGPGHPPMPIADVIDAETAAHIARQDPARILREVAAKRAILALYEEQAAKASRNALGSQTWALWPVIERLAAVYGDDSGNSDDG